MTPELIIPPYIDSTMLTCSRSCMQKLKNEFFLGLRPPGVSIDLHAGACFATAMEVFRKSFYTAHMSVDEAKQSALAAFLVSWGDFEIPDYKKTAKTKDRMWDAVEEYIAKFPPNTDHIQPYYFDGNATFEFTFAIPLEPAVDPSELMGTKLYGPDDLANAGCFPLHPSGEPWLYSGRFDMFGAYQERPCIVDDKTTGRSISTGWADQWNLRNQFLGYVWACRQTGIDINTVVARGIAILKTQINFAEAIKIYPDDLLAKWKEQLRRDMWRIRRACDTNYWDYNFADACTSFGNCMFMDMCRSNSPENWMNDFTVRRWNPLHKNPIEEKTT